MLAYRIKRPVVDDHVVIDDAILPVGESGDDGLLFRVVPTEHLLEHPQYTIGGGLQTYPVWVIPDVFKQFAYVFFRLFFCDHCLSFHDELVGLHHRVVDEEAAEINAFLKIAHIKFDLVLSAVDGLALDFLPEEIV